MTQDAILNYMAENWNRAVGPTELSQKLGLDISVIKRQLRSLYTRKRILKMHGGKYWIPIWVMADYSNEGQRYAESMNAHRTIPLPKPLPPGFKESFPDTREMMTPVCPISEPRCPHFQGMPEWAKSKKGKK